MQSTQSSVNANYGQITPPIEGRNHKWQRICGSVAIHTLDDHLFLWDFEHIGESTKTFPCFQKWHSPSNQTRSDSLVKYFVIIPMFSVIRMKV